MSSRACERVGERVSEPQDHRGAPADLLGAAGATEVELALLDVGRRELDREVTQRQVLEEVLPLRGIEEVGHDGGVLGEGAHVEPEPVHQLLRAVRDERRAARRDELAITEQTPLHGDAGMNDAEQQGQQQVKQLGVDNDVAQQLGQAASQIGVDKDITQENIEQQVEQQEAFSSNIKQKISQTGNQIAKSSRGSRKRRFFRCSTSN